MKLKDRVAIITGAGRGIGRGIALAFAAEGASLVLVSRTREQVEAVAEEARRAGAEAIALAVDVAQPDQVQAMVKEALARFSRVDILVNNAGILGPVGPLHTNDMRRWADAISTNLVGLALCCHAVVPAMIAQRGGKIINLSGAGVARPSPTLSAYGASKAAVVRLTETLALELKPYNISVNALGPGQIDTSLLDGVVHAGEGMVAPDFLAMVRRTRSGQGASLANAAALAVWLASTESDGLTGRLISATQDDWRNLGPRVPEIMASDSHTLRFLT